MKRELLRLGLKVRAVEINGEGWLVGKDVAEALVYKDTDYAIRTHVDEEDKLTRGFTGSGQNRNMICINESGLYSLVLRSKLPEAKKFKRWITSEVLPQIRKTGGYIPIEKEEVEIIEYDGEVLVI
ncbi:BRO family protein [uncultured Clostridium sp.]|uniref:BRO-N domain-containing protein n=1 Tax=uncultured Clostridium sp. TaxID=59620 RepID=UPI002599F614|nr:BRO family protein [uncultured Clostridium sp.]